MMAKKSLWIAGVLALSGWAGPTLAQPAGTSPGTSQPPASSAPAAGSRSTDRRLLELLERIDQLEREIRQLRNQVEVMGHEMDELKRRQRELYLDLDRRLREVELRGPGSGTAPAPGSGAKPENGDAKPGGTGMPAPANKAARQAYERAFNRLKEGRYPEAIEDFGDFLEKYPDTEYADNAQYWLGEAHYVSRNYNEAAREFKKVLSVYPNSPKVADAMLKLGFTYYELKQWKNARSTLEKVVAEHGGTTAAQLAQTRLKRMRQEGH